MPNYRPLVRPVKGGQNDRRGNTLTAQDGTIFNFLKITPIALSGKKVKIPGKFPPIRLTRFGATTRIDAFVGFLVLHLFLSFGMMPNGSRRR